MTTTCHQHVNGCKTKDLCSAQLSELSKEKTMEQRLEEAEEWNARRREENLDEFDDFMKKVNEVGELIGALKSSSKDELSAVSARAEEWLMENGENSCRKNENIPSDAGNTSSSVNDKTKEAPKKSKKVDRSMINKCNNKATTKTNDNSTQPLDQLRQDSMSPEAFMASVEEDAKTRVRNRKERIERSDKIKKEGNEAFRNGEYEKALGLYNKAIEVRMDSSILYLNRAVTLLKLQLYSRVLEDCATAMKLNENSLKARLYKSRALYEMGNEENSNDCLHETKNMFPDSVKEIDDYVSTWLLDATD